MSLKIENIVFNIPSVCRNILDKLSMTVHPGDFVIILGSNGSGKSSLLNCINGINKIVAGKISLGNRPVHKMQLEAIGQCVATLTQDLTESTFGKLTVEQNLILSKGVSNTSKRENFKDYLSMFNPQLPEKMQTLAKDLSGGQRQCLSLAMCLMASPKLLLLDEHTSALDPITASQVMNRTKEQVEKKKEMATLMTTHCLDTALKYGNRLIVLKNGNIAFEARGDKKRQLTKDTLLNLYR